jgi:hypothetical protein
MGKTNSVPMQLVLEFAAILNQEAIIFPCPVCIPDSYCGTNGNNLNRDGNALTRGIVAPYL